MKRQLNMLGGAGALVSLFCLNMPLFLAFLMLSLVTADNSQREYLQVCATSCELSDLSASTDCSIRGGLKSAYWVRYDEIDWATMAADPLQFDTATETILAYTMVGAAVWNKLTFDRKLGFYDFTYTEDDDVYQILLTVTFEGKSKTNRNALANSIACCDIVLQLYDNNCLGRTVGVDWDGTSFEPQIKKLRITRHLDSSGQFGDSKARDEVDIGGESLTPPLFSEADETALVL
jgi:hypothetical protein